MTRAIVLQHADFEGHGRIEPLLVERGYTLDIRETYRGDAVPSRLTAGDVLVVMGGLMGVDDLARPELTFLRHEVDLLRRCIDDDAPVLAICLGAQLLAHAAGAAVRPMTRGDGERLYEVGWAPVAFHPTSDDDPILRGVPRQPYFLHWHGDRFDLPSGARRLASTDACSEQGFHLGSRQFGLQFHCEVDVENVEAFLHADPEFALRANGAGAIDRIRRDTHVHLDAARTAGDRLLANILTAMDDPRRR